MNTDKKGKEIGRKRRAAGWVLLTLGLLVATVWVASGWWWTRWAPGRWSIGCACGILWIEHEDQSDDQRGWSSIMFEEGFKGYGWRAQGEFYTTTTHWDLWLTSHESKPSYRGGMYRVWILAFWPIPLFLWTPAALLLRSGIVARRRAITDKCKACGYDLAGLSPAADARCPECGKGA